MPELVFARDSDVHNDPYNLEAYGGSTWARTFVLLHDLVPKRSISEYRKQLTPIAYRRQPGCGNPPRPPTSKLTEHWCGAAVIKCTSRFAIFADLNAEDPIYIISCIVIVMIFVQIKLVSFTCYVDLFCAVGNMLGEFRVSC